jgi:AhpD family alkylhydroperoxidase
MTVAELNGCDYCLSAHTYLGTNLVKLDAADLAAARDGSSSDARSAAALSFARKLVTERGRVSTADVDAVSAAGYSSAELIEIILHVALNTLTNYVNTALATDIDFAVVAHRAA